MFSGGRVAALAVLIGAVLAGCTASNSDPLGAATDSMVPTEALAGPESSEAAEVVSPRRVLARELRPESEVVTNPLPSVELHDVGQDRMVNFRNIFPAEQPVLLWMWAPF